MRNIKLFAFVLITLSGCATFGTKTLYNSGNKILPKKIGFTKLEGSMIINKIQPITDSVFNSAFIQSFKKYGIADVFPSQTELSFDAPDQNAIAQICRDNNLEALVVSRLMFINVSYSVYLIPIGKSWDTEVKMKVFDSNGSLLLAVSHNTANGNSYSNIPVPEKTIFDGAKGAIKRIAKEFGWGK